MTATAQIVRKRDYSLVGASTKQAIEMGLASAEWYHSEMPRKTMKELMQRSDSPAIRDTVIWLAPARPRGRRRDLFLGGLGLRALLLRLRRALRLGVRLALARMRPRHRVQNPWMNDVVYQIASFMVMRNPVTWRWSHARHHTDTIIVGRDAEIAVMRPPDF